VLASATLDADAAAVPFVGAALQVYFTRLAASLDAASVARCDVATICPVCASRPSASVVRIGAERQNLRYLACSLCATEWHLTRVRCSSCEEEKSLKYLAIEVEGRGPQRAVARAEACDECKTYLKIYYQEHDAGVEPLADDLATLALDLLVDESGYARSGPNLLLHPGSS
jgi:FdhE protein